MAQFVGGRYQLIAQLGGGGMADVYLAKLTGKADFAKLAVVKRLKPLEDDDPDILKMFADEARLCARLNHPSIVQTFEVGEDTTGPFLVMEYLEGQPLGRIRSRAARREKTIPRGVALKILRDIVGALNYAHNMVDHDGTPLTVVHRDVSPENIMVTYAGLTKLVDFGVAKTAASMSRTRAGVLKGKVAYMAPEQARSDTNIDGRADVFAAGLLLWELLTNKRLWEGMSEAQVFERLLDKDPLPRARSIDDSVPQDLDDICAKAIAKDKEDRFATAGDLLDALETASHANNLRASDREIGQFVSSLFESEREKVKALVSGSMTKRSDASSSTGDSSIQEPLPQANRGSLDPSAPPKEESDPIMWRSLSSGSVSAPVLVGSGSTDGSSMPAETPVAVTDPTRHTAPDPKPAKSRAPMVALGAVALFAMIGVAVLVGTRLNGSDKTTPTAVATQAPPPTAAPTPELAPEVSIDVSVKPTSAKIFIDGKQVSSNPYHLKIARADAATAHEIRAEADGHDPRSMSVAFDRDRALDLVLNRTYEPPRNTPPPPTVAVAPHPPTPTPHTAAPPPTPHPTPATTPSPSKTGGISEIDPTKPKTGKQDKIDTDVFRR